MTMQARAYLIVGTILALLVAVGTVLLLTTHTTALPPARPTDAAAPSSAGATVLVASSTIPAGRTISATTAHSLFAPITLPAAAVPATAFRTQDQLASVLRYGSRTTTGLIARGQVLIASMLSGLAYPQGGSALANVLPRSVVATTVAVPALDAVNGAIAPGDHVKVVYSVPSRAGMEARFLTEDSLVVATSADGQAYTLALTAPQAALATLLQEQARTMHLLLLPSRPARATGATPPVLLPAAGGSH
jgi:Flp pilus assembly protein CpaB